ncbi:hmg CoA reductase A [Tieghemostelium lacteum]|uniref:3-hydroxy-3-methylglutaryl coenzyme A reductase n=1 Tax=Tieghemostelium lacteum TaxID=361077 RepID=A0A151ZJ45_TIELA|nr:hmg CoA reductase A [Tieghemostelium lacteum]|eukprot:KYQ93976.1 hmg CoA reductase A [Tieghemostelium lacteum]
MIELKEESFWILYILLVIPKLIAIIMSVRELFPFFKWGFNIRRSNFLVPILSNNVIVTGEEAVSFEKPLPMKASTLPPIAQVKFSPESPEVLKVSESPTPRQLQPVVEQQKQENSKKQLSEYSDQEILEKIDKGQVLPYKLESELGDCLRAVEIRRLLLERTLQKTVQHLPYQHYDFQKVQGACCENVIGYVPIPVGTAGPLMLNDTLITIPMATTEGCLVASTHRGCKAITESGGARCTIISRGMTRAPVVRFPSIIGVTQFVEWLNVSENYQKCLEIFNSTSRYARLTQIKNIVSGRTVYIRFKCDTGDAMGMNMVSKGVDAVLNYLKIQFTDMEVLSISGNVCTDKKPSAINWIEGRGRSVVCEAVISGDIVEKVLKTSVQALVDVNIAKNLVGSAMAGSIGGYNAHASNIVTAVFLATGQDCAQNVESSNCITQMESCNNGKDLYITVTMPSIEVGTVGGGTSLPAQSQCLDILGVKGSQEGKPGANADQLAKAVAAAVLAGELSLMSALSAGHLVKSHLQYNRKPTTTPTITTTTN